MSTIEIFLYAIGGWTLTALLLCTLFGLFAREAERSRTDHDDSEAQHYHG